LGLCSCGCCRRRNRSRVLLPEGRVPAIVLVTNVNNTCCPVSAVAVSYPKRSSIRPL
jgi:hypothetical protein